MLITKEHFAGIEKTVGYNCTVGINTIQSNGIYLQVTAKHPASGVNHHVRVRIEYTSDLYHFERYFLDFAIRVQRHFRNEFDDDIRVPSWQESDLTLKDVLNHTTSGTSEPIVRE